MYHARANHARPVFSIFFNIISIINIEKRIYFIYMMVWPPISRERPDDGLFVDAVSYESSFYHECVLGVCGGALCLYIS